MNNNKIIKTYKSLKILNIIFFILATIATLFFEKELFSSFFPNLKFKGISFFWCLGIMILICLIYFVNYYLINYSTSNLLYKKCAPDTYKKVFFAITPKNNIVGKDLVELISEFMSGNFDLAKTLCFKYIHNGENYTLIQYSVILLCQIFFIEKNKEELGFLISSIEPALSNPKFYETYFKIHRTAEAYLEFLNGNYSTVLNYYKNAKDNSKNKCDKYLSLYYYALSLYETNNTEEAVKLFEEIMNNANQLFVAKLSKEKLLNFVLKNKEA